MGATFREAFHRLVVEGLPPAPRAPAPSPGGDLWDALTAARSRETEPDLAEDTLLLRRAPTALFEGAWLAPGVHVRHSHGELGAACLEALFAIAGRGDIAQHRARRFRAELARRGIEVADPTSASFANDPRFGDADFAPTVAALELDGIAEAVGFHAAATVFGDGDRALAERMVALCDDTAGAWRGATAFLDARATWRASLVPPPARTARQAMIDLVAAKARHARGSHHRTQLGDRSLEAWLDPATLDAPALLAALARSPHVVPGDPDASPLVTRALAFGGPMFGVFSDADVATMRAWIAALPDEPTAVATPAPAAPIEPGRRARPAPISERALYHALLANRSVETLARARRHAERALPRVSVRELGKRDLWPYSAGRLAAWVERRLDDEVERPEDRDLAGIARHLRRADVVFSLLQLTPAALIDGAWLGGVTSPRCPPGAHAAELLRIYRDELGAGVVERHHGNVMRRALAHHGVELPPADTRAFAEHPDILDQAFKLPVLWLAIAAHTPHFMPELLGLNLAIEMAGLGRGYAKASALCRRHGIDSYFFDLHNTIDNAASGHTSWSTRAIELYLDALPDERTVAAAWLRLWQGHDAYARASRPLVQALALRLGPRLAWRWLSRRPVEAAA